MNNVLISGYYGFKNVGDEAILEILIKKIKAIDSKINISVLSANAEGTSKEHNIRGISRNKYFKIIREIKNTDILISGGGSLLQDVTGNKSLYYYLYIIMWGVVFKKKVILYSQGVGPIKGSFNRKLTCSLLKKVDFITVREKHSKKDLIDMGVPASKIEVTYDPVVDFSSIYGKVSAGIQHDKLSGTLSQQKRNIGFALRSKDFQDQKAYDALKTAVERLSTRHTIVLIPFHNTQDTAIIERLMEDVDTQALVQVNESLTSYEMFSIIKSLDIMIGVRLHSLIFAATAEKPVIGISYDPKIEYFLDTIKQAPIFTVDGFDSEKLIQRVDEIVDNYDIESERISVIMKEIKRKSSFNEELLRNFLKEG